MILLFHIVFGSLWGVLFHNVWLAFGFGFVTHYLLDKLPHFEYNIDGLKKGSGFKFILDILKVSLDITGGLLIVYYFAKNSHLEKFVLAGVIGGMLPDALLFLTWQAKRIKFLNFLSKPLSIFFRHHFNNHWDTNKKVPVWLGTTCYGLVLIASLWALSLL